MNGVDVLGPFVPMLQRVATDAAAAVLAAQADTAADVLLVSTARAGQILGDVSPATVRRLIDDGELVGVTGVGRGVRVTTASLRALVARRAGEVAA